MPPKKTLTIITDYWRIVDYENFYFIHIIENEPIDDEEGPTYSLVGIVDDIEEPTYMPLCTESTKELISEQFEKIIYCIDSEKKVVDFRKPNMESINIIKNARHNPQADLN